MLNYDLHWNPVRLIQRFGRVDRIGTEHDEIYLHNMWPDFDVDEELELTDRLTNRIQAFHDAIGLDNKLLSESEQLNQNAMYRIYGEKELPEIDDGFDELSVNQRAISLLQRIQEEDEELWRTIQNLPDGIRSALTVAKVDEDPAAERFVQNAMDIEGSQMPFAQAIDRRLSLRLRHSMIRRRVRRWCCWIRTGLKGFMRSERTCSLRSNQCGAVYRSGAVRT